MRPGPPPWWPAGEAWPPSRDHRLHWRRRSRFLRRIAAVFALVLALSAVGLATLVWLAVRHTPLAAAGVATTGVIAVAVVLAAAGVAFAAAMRRVGVPLGDVVAAADRVATGDYAARVAERGPRFLRGVARAFNGMAARLEEEDRLRREVAADVAHELRTPLAVIQGRLEGLIDNVYPRDDRRLAEILDETRVLARLVDDLGTLAHAERGTPGLRREPTDVALLLHDVARSLGPEAEARGASLRVEEAAELPLLDVDPVRIREVLTNLVSNAIRHSVPGTAVTIAAVPLPDALALEVRDTGPGIPAEQLEHVFDRFQKGAGSTGSGLGLAIARKLVEAHGGRIAIASAVGRGTTARFTLPNHPSP